jgi:hypothetical protein
MSRGLGRCEREILKCLESYAGLGQALGLTWTAEGSFNRKYLVDHHNIDDFERGYIVEVRRLRRETGFKKTVLSRALRSLDRKGLVILYGANLEFLSEHSLRVAA